MSLLTVRKKVASYLQIPLDQTIVDGVDLILEAINDGRKLAEKEHDWNCEVETVTLSHTKGKGSWAVGLVDGLSTKVKQPETFYLGEEGQTIPIPHTTKRIENNRSIEHRHYGRHYRHRRDGECSNPDYIRVVLHGHKFAFNYELASTDIVTLDCYKWLDDYVDDEDTDFFLEHGSDYLMWHALISTNYRFETFVPQQEGTLSPPEKMRQQAFDSLVLVDSTMLEGSRLI